MPSALVTLLAGDPLNSRSEASTPMTGSVKVMVIEVRPVMVVLANGVWLMIRGLLGLSKV